MINSIFKQLVKQDPTLSFILLQDEPCPLLNRANIKNIILLDDLARIVIGQQISQKAANTIYNRIQADFPDYESRVNFLRSLNNTEKNSYGISRNKLKCIQEIHQHYLTKSIDFENLEKLSKAQVITELTKIKGIGLWTCEMFMIFSLKRLDIFSQSDAGLKKAIKKLYKLNNLTDADLVSISKKWIPYRSIVSWFLWRSLEK